MSRRRRLHDAAVLKEPERNNTVKTKLMAMLLAAGAMFGAWAHTETVDGIVWNYTVSGGKAQVGIGGYSGTRAVSTICRECRVPSRLSP